MIPVTIIVVIAYNYILPIIIDSLLRSGNLTFQWVGGGINEFVKVINREQGITDASFMSRIVSLSDNPFELIFGSGHSIYGTREILGYGSDIGYLNWLWIYGIFGASIIFIYMIGNMKKAFIVEKNVCIKTMVVFSIIAYIVVMVKGNLLGSNPGTFATYLLVYAVLFWGEESNDSKNKNVYRLYY